MGRFHRLPHACPILETHVHLLHVPVAGVFAVAHLFRGDRSLNFRGVHHFFRFCLLQKCCPRPSIVQ